MVMGILAVLSASAAAGMRVGLPLLAILLLNKQQSWFKIPFLTHISPQIGLSILISWSLFELFGSKQLLGQRIIQIFQLFLSPFVGAFMALTVVKLTEIDLSPLWLIGLIGGLLAFVLNLVQVGWFFRLGGIPIWVVIIEDILCLTLVLFAFHAPAEGGLIAMVLLWLSIRSSKEWRKWYRERTQVRSN